MTAHKQNRRGVDGHVPQRWLFFASRTLEEVVSVIGASSPVGPAVAAQCHRIDLTIPNGAGATGDALLTFGTCAEVRVSNNDVSRTLRQEASELRRWFHDAKASIVSCGPAGFLTTVRETLAEILFPPNADDDLSVSQHQLTMREMQGDVVFEDWNQRK
jgi:hypothetical protein